MYNIFVSHSVSKVKTYYMMEHLNCLPNLNQSIESTNSASNLKKFNSQILLQDSHRSFRVSIL